MATTINSHVLGLAMLVMIGTSTLGDHQVLAECGASFSNLVLHCSRYVKIEGPKEAPNQACCQLVVGIDIPCVCKYVTPEVEKMVSMEKVVYVARTCGLAVQPGMKCGSYVVPPVA